MQESEQALYAYSSGQEKMDKTYTQTLDWITTVENQLSPGS